MANAFRSGTSILEHQVQAWRTLVIAIRKQTSAASDYLALQELLLLFFSIVSGIGAVFLAAFNGYGDNALEMGRIYAVIVIWLLGRLFCKAYLAERVTDAVSGLTLMVTDKSAGRCLFNDIRL